MTIQYSFSNFVEKFKSTHPSLPLMHTTDAYSSREIINTEELSVRNCKVLKDRFIYFFYGRPSYRPNQGSDPTSNMAYFPVCFVLQSNCARRDGTLPFDSGAFAGNYFSRYFHKNTNVLNFDMSFPLAAEKTVTAFFENNRLYLNGSCNVDEDSLPPFEFEVQGYVDLIKSKGSNVFDQRATSIEIRTKENVKLHQNLIAIIAPRPIVGDISFRDSITKFGNVDVIDYEVTPRKKPEDYLLKIEELAMSYLQKKGII